MYNFPIVKFGIVFKAENKKDLEKSFLRSSSFGPFDKLRTPGLEKARMLAKEVEKWLVKEGQEVLDEKNLKNADVVITLGGDGTLIHKSCEFADLGVPFVGINTGNLGFLTACEANDWQESLKKLINGSYFVSERLSVDAAIGGHKEVYRAINEVVVRGLYRVVDLEIKVGGVKLLRVLGDGVIVSTQTGSTAYSLSAGGPIVDPDLDCLLLTPINPIGLPIPSAVFSAESEIEVKLVKGDDVSLVLDGQEHTRLNEGDKVKITRGKYKIKFIYFDKHHFIKSLNAKFGLSSRSVGQ